MSHAVVSLQLFDPATFVALSYKPEFYIIVNGSVHFPKSVNREVKEEEEKKSKDRPVQ